MRQRRAPRSGPTPSQFHDTPRLYLLRPMRSHQIRRMSETPRYPISGSEQLPIGKNGTAAKETGTYWLRNNRRINNSHEHIAVSTLSRPRFQASVELKPSQFSRNADRAGIADTKHGKEKGHCRHVHTDCRFLPSRSGKWSHEYSSLRSPI